MLTNYILLSGSFFQFSRKHSRCEFFVKLKSYQTPRLVRAHETVAARLPVIVAVAQVLLPQERSLVCEMQSSTSVQKWSEFFDIIKDFFGRFFF